MSHSNLASEQWMYVKTQCNKPFMQISHMSLCSSNFEIDALMLYYLLEL